MRPRGKMPRSDPYQSNPAGHVAQESWSLHHTAILLYPSNSNLTVPITQTCISHQTTNLWCPLCKTLAAPRYLADSIVQQHHRLQYFSDTEIISQPLRAPVTSYISPEGPITPYINPDCSFLSSPQAPLHQIADRVLHLLLIKQSRG